jgi:hypothetical protein
MNNFTLILGCGLLLGPPLLAREKTDVIVMNNGDRLTGEVKGLSTGVLHVSLDYVDGTVSVSWSKVARIESSQLFIVKTDDGSVYTGKLGAGQTSGGRPAALEVLEQNQTLELNPSQVVRVTETSENFWRRFNGSIGYGIIYAKANRSTQYNFNSDVEYLRELWSAAAAFNSNLSSSTGATTATRNEVTLSGTHLLPSKHYYYSGLVDFLESSEQGINLQTSLGAGVGRYLKNTQRVSFAVTGGMAWQSTDYRAENTAEAANSTTHQNLATALVGARLKVFQFSKTKLDVTAIVFPVLSDPGRVKFNTNASYYVKFFGNLTWNLSFYGNWDNRPPNNLPTSDYGSSSGLSWTFGMR